MTKNERLKKIRAALNLTQLDFAEKIGITRGSYANIESGQRGLTKQTTLLILQAFNRLSPEYLESGKGPIFIDDESNIRSVQPLIQENIVNVPFVSIAATASFVDSYCNDATILETMPVVGITEEDLEKHRYILIEVEGTSMEPTLRAHSRILCKPVDMANWEYTTGVHAICYDNAFVIKRIKKNDLMREGLLTLHSDNPLAGEFTIKKDDIRSIWKAISKAFEPID